MVASFRWSRVEELPLALYTWVLMEAEALPPSQKSPLKKDLFTPKFTEIQVAAASSGLCITSVPSEAVLETDLSSLLVVTTPNQRGTD